jgi:hypothetical protein
MSGILVNLCPFRAIFNFEKSQKLQMNKVDGPFFNGTERFRPGSLSPCFDL